MLRESERKRSFLSSSFKYVCFYSNQPLERERDGGESGGAPERRGKDRVRVLP